MIDASFWSPMSQVTPQILWVPPKLSNLGLHSTSNPGALPELPGHNTQMQTFPVSDTMQRLPLVSVLNTALPPLANFVTFKTNWIMSLPL